MLGIERDGGGNLQSQSGKLCILGQSWFLQACRSSPGSSSLHHKSVTSRCSERVVMAITTEVSLSRSEWSASLHTEIEVRRDKADLLCISTLILPSKGSSSVSIDGAARHDRCCAHINKARSEDGVRRRGRVRSPRA